MKLHLPVSLHKALLACFAVVASITQGATVVVSEMSRVSEAAVDNTITIDYANPEATIPHANGTLQLTPVTSENKGVSLKLNNTGLGDGKTYTLATGVSGLVDAEGNPISLDSTNNAISNYFDTTQPGTGFWANGILQLSTDGTLQFVRHNESVKEAVTITTRQTGDVDYQYYEGVSFADIEYTTSSSDAYGGAISGNYDSTITLSNNGSVTFSGNTASSSSSYARGGAIYGGSRSTITVSNNGSVTFSGNTASSSSFYAYGGAIYGYSSSTITLRDNESVVFSGNTASGSDYVCGGAIYGGSRSTITVSNNGSVTFSGNTASSSSFYAEGGAIYGDYSSTITLSNNGSVEFSGNTASSSSSSSYGGAIAGTVTMESNGDIAFTGNTASSGPVSVYGGAICGTVTMAGNGDIVFSGNTASSSSSSSSYGGAIYGDSSSTIMLSNNGSVEFSGNTASGYSASGGAIYGGDDSTIMLSNNGSVEFSGNTASSTGSSASGGAIGGGMYSTITLSNNGSVEFSGNTASGTSLVWGGAIAGSMNSTITLSDNGSVVFSGNTIFGSAVSSGAIYAYGNLSIRNNDSVLFEKNAVISNGTYRLNSIYAGRSGDVISLSAAAGKSIEFRDAVYISSSTVNLNADYGDIKQQGDIIFTGKYTEYHLNELLDAAGAGRTATAEEILNSRTTVVYTMTNLYGGRLRVEDGAIYHGYGITVHEGSGATVLVKDAELHHSGYDLTFNAGSTLELEGNNTISGNVQMLAGSTLLLNAAEKGVLSEIIGNLNLAGGITLNLGDGSRGENELLLYVSGGWSGWDTDSLTVTGSAAKGDVSLVDNLLILNYNAETFNRYFNGAVKYTSRCDGLHILKYHYESVSYEDISSVSDGGAIYGSVTMTGNGDIAFSGNSAFCSSEANGGAIYGAVTMTDNGNIAFSGNTASSSSSSSYGGAIYGSVTMAGNGDIVFSGNTAYSGSYIANGGAIYGTVTMTDNGDITFSGNTAFGSYFTYGGAIYGSVTMESNGDIAFTGNTASSGPVSVYGGAICGTVTMAGNGDIVFSGNTASSSSSSSYGGAIYGDWDSTITLSNNGSVEFSGNTASSSSSSSYGGAIYGDSYSSITLSDNGSVEFCKNTASGTSAAYGGAIYGDSHSSITLSNNGSVRFSGNTASSSLFSAYGGAIYTFGGLSIQNNDFVLFEKNAEISKGTYRLRSVYAGGGENLSFSLSAAAGKSIEFRDSVYIGSGSTVNLNADYTDAEGNVHKQQGDIIFTGATTVDDLYDVKGDIDGTEEEIRLSRITEVNTMTNLYGGRLRVEEGAIYQGRGITAHKGSASTVRIQNAELSHVGYALEFNAGTALEVAGNSTIRGNVNLLADSLFKLEKAASLSLHETLEADAAELTVQGTALLAGSATLNASLTLADGATLDMMRLDAGAVTLNGALTFGAQVEMGENLMAILKEMRGWEESVTLFTGIESLVLPQVVTSGDSGRVWVGDVFSNLAGNESYYIDFKADVGALLVVHVPEPTTTSLSLLVLAAFAARRRRG